MYLASSLRLSMAQVPLVSIDSEQRTCVFLLGCYCVLRGVQRSAAGSIGHRMAKTPCPAAHSPRAGGPSEGVRLQYNMSAVVAGFSSAHVSVHVYPLIFARTLHLLQRLLHVFQCPPSPIWAGRYFRLFPSRGGLGDSAEPQTRLTHPPFQVGTANLFVDLQVEDCN